MESTEPVCAAADESAAAATPRTALYARLAEEIAASIRGGAWEKGERIPSVRQFSRERRVSAATVIRAHELLEERGYIETVPRSGRYVSDSWRERAGPAPAAPSADRLTPLDVGEIVFQLLDSIRDRDVVQFGSPFASPELFPLAALARTLSRGARRIDPWRTVGYLADGSLELRRQIAQRYLRHGASVAPDEIVVTSGALEGLNLCLQVVTRPGDTIAIETPTFYGCLHAVESLGLRALEIPAHARDGADLTALAQALATAPVRACWFMTTYQNPLGICMPSAAKRKLVRLLETHDVPLIEDNVYSELYHGAEPPTLTKAFDRRGIVLECGSFSKCLSPGYRVGWVAAGRYAEAVRRRKLMSSLETNILAQDAVAAFLRTGAYERHLRGVRRVLASRQAAALKSLDRHLPAGFRVVRPEGGYFLWIELPGLLSAVDLYRVALSRGISIAPGPIFSPRREFDHFVRLNYGHPWTAVSDAAVATLADIMRALMRKAAA
jgi:DNA-binding transcriptional MocR family regulator